MLNNTFSSESITQLLADPSTLCVLPLSGQCQASQLGVIETGLTGFSAIPIQEVWQVNGQTVERGLCGAVHWAKVSDLVCVSRWLDSDASSSLESIVELAYQELLDFLQSEGFPHLVRCWNYLPGINVGEQDAEVYKRFCTGRLSAFQLSGMGVDVFPSASALGHHAQGGVIFAFASKVKPQHFANTRQVNAYEYPREYGLSSPSFARATSITIANQHYLFISGTASIIGHQTMAPGDLAKQLTTTIANIEHLLQTSNPHGAELRTMKVYLRHQEHFQLTEEWLRSRYPSVLIILALADICRMNLLVEIECFCQHPISVSDSGSLQF